MHRIAERLGDRSGRDRQADRDGNGEEEGNVAQRAAAKLREGEANHCLTHRLDIHNAAVLHAHDGIAVLSGMFIVGDHDEGLVEFIDDAPEKLQYRLASFRIETAGRFVGKDHRGAREQAAGDSDALALPRRVGWEGA